MICSLQREYADWQPLSANGDGDFERSVLAGQPRQRAGLRKAYRHVIAGVTRRRREDHRAERGWRQEHHLFFGEMRREPACDVMLCKRRGGAHNQLGAADSLGNVRSHQRQLHVVPAIGVLEDDARARRAMLRYLGCIAPPQADVVAS